MQFQIFQIESGRGYTFIIGCESPPTHRLREEIGGVLAAAWGELLAGENSVKTSYGFDLVFDKTPPTGENEIPLLEPGRNYFVFALLESESGSTVGEPETVEGIMRALVSSFGDSPIRPRIGLIALYNCNVTGIRSKQSYPVQLSQVVDMPDPLEDIFGQGWRSHSSRGKRWNPYGD